MPTYEYLCKDCGYQFEQFQSITADSLKICPQCDKKGLKRLIGSGSGVIFKGSGFYQTDYRSENYKKAAKKAEDSGTTKEAGTKPQKKDGGAKTPPKAESKKD